jgi:iron-sulfur cluster assembly protein
MSVTLTEAAAERVKRFLADQQNSPGLRFGVRRTGCSGYAYVVDLAKEVTGRDEVFESRGIRVIVDGDSLALVDGTEIDYRSDGLSATFQFNNPQVKDACGCGESFSV